MYYNGFVTERLQAVKVARITEKNYNSSHMATDKTVTLYTSDAASTELVGEHIGKQLRGGEVIELVSDLGGGKTTFVRGLAKGAGSDDHVASPTFTVSREYETPKGVRIYHFDFYRLAEAGIMEQELAEIAQDPQAVAVIEWSDVVRHVLPDEHMRIELRRTGDDSRELAVTCADRLDYLLQDIPDSFTIASTAA